MIKITDFFKWKKPFPFSPKHVAKVPVKLKEPIKKPVVKIGPEGFEGSEKLGTIWIGGCLAVGTFCFSLKTGVDYLSESADRSFKQAEADQIHIQNEHHHEMNGLVQEKFRREIYRLEDKPSMDKNNE